MSVAELPTNVCQRIPVLEGLTADECRELLALAEPCEYPVGETIVFQGRQVQRLWILLDGTCEVVKQREGRGGKSDVVLATLEPHASFGEMSFFHRAPHSASVRAKTAVKLLRIERAPFDKLLAGDSIAAYKLALNSVGSLAERMRRMDTWVAELLDVPSKTPKVNDMEQLRRQLFEQWSV